MNDKQKKALIVWGGWEGHTPQQSADLVRGMLDGHGFAVTVDNEHRVVRRPGPRRQ